MIIDVTRRRDLDRLARALEQARYVGLDLETSGLDPHTDQLRAVGFAVGEDVYRINDPDIDLTGLAGPLQSPQLKVVAHNHVFDWKWFYHHYAIPIANPICTQVFEKLLTAGLRQPAGLADLEIKYLGLDRRAQKKATQRSFIGQSGPLNEEQLAYLADDVRSLVPILKRQWALIKAKGLVETAELELQLIPVIAQMELTGICVDWAAWEAWVAQHVPKQAAIARELEAKLKPRIHQTYFKDPLWLPPPLVNLNSPEQVKVAFKTLGVELVSTEEEVLQLTLRSELPPKAKEALALLLRYRELEKLRSTYGTAYISRRNPVTNRLHIEFRQLGAEATGRMSSTPNSQNIPAQGEGAKIRKFFVAPPGQKLAICDYCLAPDTLIQTIDGPRPLASLKPGDKVFSLRDRRVVWNTVVRSNETGVLPCYRVAFDNGGSVVASADHRWPVREWRSRQGFQLVARTTEDLQPGDRMVPLKRATGGGGYTYLYSYSPLKHTRDHILVAEAADGLRPSGYHTRVVSVEFVGMRPCWSIQTGPDNNYFLGCGVLSYNSSQELRIAAEVTRDRNMIDAFLKGEDLHSKTACLIFKRDYDEFQRLIREAEAGGDEPEHKIARQQRRISKTINFAIFYGGGPGTISARLTLDGVDTTWDQAKEYLDQWFQGFKQAGHWIHKYGKYCVRDLYAETLGGRKRFFAAPQAGDDFDRQVGSIQRAGTNAVIQGTAADMSKRAMVLVAKRLAPLGGQILNQVHDELVVSVPAPLAEQAAEMTRRAMIEAGEYYLRRVPVEVGVTVAEYWKK